MIINLYHVISHYRMVCHHPKFTDVLGPKHLPGSVSLARFCTAGMRVEPPTKITWHDDAVRLLC